MKAQRYALGLIWGVVLMTACVGAVNRIIDPFWYYRDFEIASVNKIKGQAVRAYERHVKPQVLLRETPDAIIIGNSLAEIGFPPTNRAFTENAALKGYNFGIAGAKWERVQCYFDFAVNRLALKRIVIGILPENLPKTDCKGKLPEIDAFSEIKLLFSRQAIASSWRVMAGQKSIKSDYTREGLYFYNRDLAGIKSRFKAMFDNEPRTCVRSSLNPGMKAEAAMSELPEAASGLDLQGLKHMLRLAHEKNIALRIVVYPKHALAQEFDMACGWHQHHWAILHSIVDMAEKERGDFEIWEFDRYNDYTAEPIEDRISVYWQDPHHFNHEFGEVILNAIFSSTRHSEADIGSQLTQRSIKSAYRSSVASRNKYLLEHPEFLQEFESYMH